MQAVILAGGAGTRLYPLTLKTPKAMVKIKGRPFVGIIIESLKKYGIKNIVFCIGHLAGQFKEYFGDGSRFGIKTAYSVETGFMGTGGALKEAERYLKKDFFVINGDTYLPVDYAAIYKSFRSSRKMGLAVLYDNHERIARPNMAIDAKGLVTGYAKREKLKRGHEEIPVKGPSAQKYKFVDAGVGVFNKKVIELIPGGCFVTLETDIFPKLIRRREMASYIVSQRYFDIGTPERLKKFMTARIDL